MADNNFDLTSALKTALFSMFGKPEDLEKFLGSDDPLSSFIANIPRGVREAAGGQVLAGLPEFFISRGWKQAGSALAQGIPGAVNLAPMAEFLSPLAMYPAFQESAESQSSFQEFVNSGGSIRDWDSFKGQPKSDPKPTPSTSSTINERQYNLPQFTATKAPKRSPTRQSARASRERSRRTSRSRRTNRSRTSISKPKPPTQKRFNLRY